MPPHPRRDAPCTRRRRDRRVGFPFTPARAQECPSSSHPPPQPRRTGVLSGRPSRHDPPGHGTGLSVSLPVDPAARKMIKLGGSPILTSACWPGASDSAGRFECKRDGFADAIGGGVWLLRIGNRWHDPFRRDASRLKDRRGCLVRTSLQQVWVSLQGGAEIG
jgi:hypothetical protein